MIRGQNRKFELIAAKADLELLPALAGAELKRRRLIQELSEVLIEYQQLELEIDRRRIVIPWLTSTREH